MDNEHIPIHRQAIVIIHGMGEQRPNTTLRGFIRCLVAHIKATTGKEPLYFEKPDKVSGTYETRSMVILRDLNVGRPTTHIYEFYWAHHMRDTSWQHVQGWLARLLFTRSSNVPPRLRKVFRNLWIMLIAVLLLTLGFAFITPMHKFIGPLLALGWLITLLKMALSFAESAILKTMGDAARYMTDNPDNIEQRQQIRKEGIDLLRHLHDARDDRDKPLFDRIIVVSHSLGTVVAYDLLRLMWVEYSETFDNTRPFIPNKALTTMEQAGSNIPAGFPDLQYECWENQRRMGNKWLITDFVTMGSPLTYFDYLIVGSTPEFLQRVAEREYPTCPPVPDADPSLGYHWHCRRTLIPGLDIPATIDLVNYSSLFACIRWTNLFFSSDFVGGPLQPKLGPGITDVEIPAPNARFKFIYPFGHTDYWNTTPGGMNAIRQIADAMRL